MWFLMLSDCIVDEWPEMSKANYGNSPTPQNGQTHSNNFVGLTFKGLMFPNALNKSGSFMVGFKQNSNCFLVFMLIV